METKQIEVTCPCCSTTLVVDVLTRKIMRAVSPAEIDETGKAVLDESRWDAATKRIEERSGTALDKLESGLDDERNKESHLDDLFDKARKKVQTRQEKTEDFEP